MNNFPNLNEPIRPDEKGLFIDLLDRYYVYDKERTENFLRSHFQVLSKNFNEKIARTVRKGSIKSPTPVYLLLCPAYPYNYEEKRFTYEGQMTGDVSPTLQFFIRQVIKLRLSLAYQGIPLENIVLRPLTCEIEGDIQHVIDIFAGGSPDVFNSLVRSTSDKSTYELQTCFPNFRIEGGVFGDQMPDIDANREIIYQNINGLLENGRLNIEFLQNLQNVAYSRISMFDRLYGAGANDYFLFAVRQMVSYLAVTRSLSDRNPQGAVVFNMNTPNSFYVKDNMHRYLRELLNITGERLPNFYFC